MDVDDGLHGNIRGKWAKKINIKDLDESKGQLTVCPVCGSSMPPSKLQSHANACLDRLERNSHAFKPNPSNPNPNPNPNLNSNPPYRTHNHKNRLKNSPTHTRGSRKPRPHRRNGRTGAAAAAAAAYIPPALRHRHSNRHGSRTSTSRNSSGGAALKLRLPGAVIGRFDFENAVSNTSSLSLQRRTRRAENSGHTHHDAHPGRTKNRKQKPNQVEEGKGLWSSALGQAQAPSPDERIKYKLLLERQAIESALEDAEEASSGSDATPYRSRRVLGKLGSSSQDQQSKSGGDGSHCRKIKDREGYYSYGHVSAGDFKAASVTEARLMALIIDGDIDGIEAFVRTKSGRRDGEEAGGVDRQMATLRLGISVHVAAAAGRPAVLHHLIKRHGFDIYGKDHKRRTPLHVACLADHSGCAKLLIEAKAQTNVRDINGDQPLHSAALSHSHACARLLLRSTGASLQSRNKQGHTPLHAASSCGAVRCVKVMLSSSRLSQIQLARTKGTQSYALHVATRHPKVVRLLLKSRASANARDSRGLTPLAIACRNGHLASAEILINNDARVNVSSFSPKGGATGILLSHSPLHDAAAAIACTHPPAPKASKRASSVANIVDLLLKSKADPNSRATSGNKELGISGGDTPLLTAVRAAGELAGAASGSYNSSGLNSGSNENESESESQDNDDHRGAGVEVVQMVLCAGGDAGVRCGYSQNTALHVAAGFGDHRTLACLLESMKEGSRNGTSERTNERVIAGDLAPNEIKQACLPSGPIRIFEVVNRTNMKGETPLLLAIRRGSLPCARLLLKNFAMMDSRCCAFCERRMLHLLKTWQGEAASLAFPPPPSVLHSSTEVNVDKKEELTLAKKLKEPEIRAKAGVDRGLSCGVDLWGTSSLSASYRSVLPLHLSGLQLYTLFARQEWCDCWFRLREGCVVGAHKAVLVARSEYFRALFAGPLSKISSILKQIHTASISSHSSSSSHTGSASCHTSSTSRASEEVEVASINMTAHSAQVFHSVLAYLYTLSPPHFPQTSTIGQLAQVLALANELLLPDLRDAAAAELNHRMDANNALTLLKLAEMHNADRLAASATLQLVGSELQESEIQAWANAEIERNLPTEREGYEYHVFENSYQNRKDREERKAKFTSDSKEQRGQVSAGIGIKSCQLREFSPLGPGVREEGWRSVIKLRDTAIVLVRDDPKDNTKRVKTTILTHSAILAANWPHFAGKLLKKRDEIANLKNNKESARSVNLDDDSTTIKFSVRVCGSALELEAFEMLVNFFHNPDLMLQTFIPKPHLTNISATERRKRKQPKTSGSSSRLSSESQEVFGLHSGFSSGLSSTENIDPGPGGPNCEMFWRILALILLVHSFTQQQQQQQQSEEMECDSGFDCSPLSEAKTKIRTDLSLIGLKRSLEIIVQKFYIDKYTVLTLLKTIDSRISPYIYLSCSSFVAKNLDQITPLLSPKFQSFHSPESGSGDFKPSKAVSKLNAVQTEVKEVSKSLFLAGSLESLEISEEHEQTTSVLKMPQHPHSSYVCLDLENPGIRKLSQCFAWNGVLEGGSMSKVMLSLLDGLAAEGGGDGSCRDNFTSRRKTNNGRHASESSSWKYNASHSNTGSGSSRHDEESKERRLWQPKSTRGGMLW